MQISLSRHTTNTLVVVATHAGGRTALAAAEGYAHRIDDAGGPACPAATTGRWTAVRYARLIKIPMVSACPNLRCFGRQPCP